MTANGNTDSTNSIITGTGFTNSSINMKSTVVTMNLNESESEKCVNPQQEHRYRRLTKLGVENAVLVKNLCKGYDKNGPLILNNFCMSVTKGSIYGLLGSSGCGKTTALSCIVGLKEWESGEITVFGQTPGTKRSGIPGKLVGYVPQDIALYDHLSIKENIQYYGRLYGMSEYDILEQWQLLVNLLQLPSEYKLVINLSGGQRRRTSLALALVHNPSLLILDEPTVGLDPLLRESVWKHLYKLVERGTTIIITTHYIEESRYSDKIGVMRHGRLLVEESPSVLMHQYKTDLLEDVVLKLCWEDSKKTAIRKRSHHDIICVNNNQNHQHHTPPPSRKESEESDDDSGTGTDNDPVVEGDGCQQIDDSRRVSATSSADDDSHIQDNANEANPTVIQIVPNGNDASGRPRQLTRSTSSDFAGVLFHSKWKVDGECVALSHKDNSLQGQYKQNAVFDSSPAYVAPFEREIRSDNLSPRSENGPKQWLADGLEMCQRIAAFCCVIYLNLVRHPVFFLAALILPAIEVLLTVGSVGDEPKGLRMAVINDEMPDWITKCPLDSLDTSLIRNLNTSLVPTTMNSLLNDDELDCNFNELSCKYLNEVSKSTIVDLVPYGNTEDAVKDVERGDLWGYIKISSNYSQHMLDRLATKQFAFEESINGSIISVRMDMSQYLGSILVIQHLFNSLQEYIQQLIGSCDLGARQVEIPLHFRKPVYGTAEGDYNAHLIPGVLASIMFMMPFAISGMIFIVDIKLGTLERARVAGLTTLELMITYAITQGTIVVGQSVICTLCLKFGFNFEIVGSTLLYIGMTLLLGMCGQAFGLLVGIICQDEIEALITAVFILPFMLLYGGVLWPLDCMAPTWKIFGSILPTTLISESLRSISVRGVGITHILMWPGVAVTSGWLVFFWIACPIAYKYLVK